jgi:3-oxoacyl-[acyl-carrier protein] reductase
MAWGIEADVAETVAKTLAGRGAETAALEADLADAGTPERVSDEVERRSGVTVLVMCHCESVDSDLLDTTSPGDSQEHSPTRADRGRRLRSAAR